MPAKTVDRRLRAYPIMLHYNIFIFIYDGFIAKWVRQAIVSQIFFGNWRRQGQALYEASSLWDNTGLNLR